MVKIKILLDAGHGAGKKFNRGFVQVGNYTHCNEGDCNYLYCTEYLKPELEKYGIEVGLTRKKIEDDPSLVARGQMGKGYDLLISCHSNAFNGKASGVEVWDSTNPKESIKPLCDLICKNVADTLKITNRGTKYRKNRQGQNWYGILRNGQGRHNFIIEHCFHDNIRDVRKYRTNLEGTAKAVAKAIADYYKLEPIKEEKEILDCPYQKTYKCPYFKEKEVVEEVVKENAVYKEINGLQMLITDKSRVKIEYVGNKNLRQVGKYGINGTFFTSSKTPNGCCNIAVNKGLPIGANSSFNSYTGVKKGTFIIDNKGDIHVERLSSTDGFNRNPKNMREGRKIDFAVGGVELIPTYDPIGEGTLPDVLGYAYHTGIGYKGNDVYLIVTEKPCTLAVFREKLKSLGLQGAINLDGGGSSQLYWKNNKGLNQSRGLCTMIGVAL